MPRGALADTGPGRGVAPALVVAHRGAWGAEPQNSLQAFERAVLEGCDVVELDVRRTADGRIVVVHDPRVGLRTVAKVPHDELRGRLQAGQAPELEEVLELAAGRIAVDVELKEDGYVEQAMTIVAGRLTPEQYVVTSFRDAALTAVRRVAPDARTGLLLSPRRRTMELERRLAAAGVDFIAPHVGLARAGLLAWAWTRGISAWVWTVNDSRRLRTLLGDPRVGAVITDRARLAVAIAGRLGAEARPAA